ncbi:MAG: hypothetical protein J0H80_06770, partial [Rhizobiales bacterium]|nr:hypothetical protein [Hyphomicrobiales bacterium]
MRPVAMQRRGEDMEAAFGRVIDRLGVKRGHQHVGTAAPARARHHRQRVEIVVFALPGDLLLAQQG